MEFMTYTHVVEKIAELERALDTAKRYANNAGIRIIERDLEQYRYERDRQECEIAEIEAEQAAENGYERWLDARASFDDPRSW